MKIKSLQYMNKQFLSQEINGPIMQSLFTGIRAAYSSHRLTLSHVIISVTKMFFNYLCNTEGLVNGSGTLCGLCILILCI